MNLDSLKSLFSGAGTGGAQVETISGPSAVQFHNDADTVFVDVRGHGEIQTSGTVKGAIVAPLPEFASHGKSVV